MAISKEELNNRFTYHAPKEGQPAQYQALREKAKEFAELANEMCPDSREKSHAMTLLESSVFWFNASIARS